jgi:hypothetical protein
MERALALRVRLHAGARATPSRRRRLSLINAVAVRSASLNQESVRTEDAMRIDAARRIAANARCAALIAATAGVWGCAQVATVADVTSKPPLALPIAVHVEPCVDRTETPGRELGVQAKAAFDEKLRATREFVVAEDSRYRLSCDVTSFVEGSALKRWILPGWGATVGQVSGMLTDSATGDVLVIARGNATVAGGGLYSIGADTYIVPAAVGDIVVQLCAWARGETPGTTGEAGAPVTGGPKQ